MNEMLSNQVYAIYARKSSENEERQIQSIESQIQSLKNQFGDANIITIVEESKSAFKPNSRPKFEGLIGRIRSGEITGLIAWHPDRLSRNPIDGAAIVHLLQLGHLQDLKFATYPFHNSPDGIMMLQIALSQSQYFSSKLSVDVKRGMNKKCLGGWRPHLAPTGYLNDPISAKGEKKIFVDKDRSPLIKKAFDMMATGLYSVGYVLQKLNNEWGYMSRPTKKSPSSPMSVSGLYKVFENKFYAGIIKMPDGSEQIGKHKPLISLDQFNQVQQIIKSRNGSKGNHKKCLEFVYKPLLNCGECQGVITAERKFKRNLKGICRAYIYYHCTHNKPNCHCKQQCIEEKVITACIQDLLQSIILHPIFKAWTIFALESMPKDKAVNTQRDKSILTLESRLSKLEDSFFDNLISYETYDKKHKEIKLKLTELQLAKKNEYDLEKQKDKACLDLVETVSKGKFILQNGSIDEKRDLLHKIASNYSIFDKKLTVHLNKWMFPVKDFNKINQAKIRSFEPLKNRSAIDLIESNKQLFLQWSSTVHDIRTFL